MRLTVPIGLCAAALAAQSLSLFRVSSLDFVLRHSPTSQKYLVETMAGGVALFDYNNDGRLDVFLVNGGKLDDPVKLPVDFKRRDSPFWNRLYRQNADGGYSDVTASAGLALAPNHYGMGAATGDYDNDGFTDLYVTGYSQNVLYRNNGDGTFTDVTREAGVAGSGWSVSAAFLDYDNDGRLDLFVSRYVQWDIAHNLLCGKPFYAYCRPDKFEGTTNLLFHNEGSGRFRDVTAASGMGSFTGKGMAVAVNDYDGDGFPDIFVSNDGMEQFLLHNRRDGTFEEKAMAAGAALTDDGKPFSGMGAAFADYDNDGRPDILVANLALEKWALYHNDGGGRFTYASLTTGLADLAARHSGWGIGLVDFDNDGWKDIFASQSHVLDNVERMNAGLRYLEPPALLRNRDGKFERVDLGEMAAVAGRGVAFGDLNNDGYMDAVISVLGGHPVVLMNRGGTNHALTLKLVGTRSNRDGSGARVMAAGQTVYATTSGSYLSASDGRVHVGIGAATESDVEIVWPSGKRQREKAAADRVVTVKETE